MDRSSLTSCPVLAPTTAALTPLTTLYYICESSYMLMGFVEQKAGRENTASRSTAWTDFRWRASAGNAALARWTRRTTLPIPRSGSFRRRKPPFRSQVFCEDPAVEPWNTASLATGPGLRSQRRICPFGASKIGRLKMPYTVGERCQIGPSRQWDLVDRFEWRARRAIVARSVVADVFDVLHLRGYQ